VTATQEPIYIGDDVTLVAVFRNRLKALANPTTVTGKVYNPATSLTVPVTFILQTTGVWEATWTPTEEGVHWWSANGAGAIAKGGERSVTVNKRRVPA